MKRILIIEDDPAIALGLDRALQGAGYKTFTACTGVDGVQLAKEVRPDLLILDLMLPGMSGFEICKRVREEGMTAPIIMLTSKAEENDKVLGFELGADDYVTKPFSLRELLARVKSHLRRAGGQKGVECGNERLRFGELELNFKRREVTRSGRVLKLTNREFLLLEYLIRHPGELLTRDRLLDEIWGYDAYPSTRTVDNHILRLRKHIEPRPNSPRYIKTIHGAGYLFEK